MIVKYFEKDGHRVFDVIQALEDSGWCIELSDILSVADLDLASRNNPDHRETVSSITLPPLMDMYIVHFKTGGFLLLDHAIEQFEKVTKDDEEIEFSPESYPFALGLDWRSTYKSLWLGWWLITWRIERHPWRVRELNIVFQPGL